MLTKIIEFSVRNKLVVGLLVIALIAYGTYQATQLPIDAVPDITNNQVQVITTAPSFGATDIERLVTFPIEQANSNISGIKEIRSFSRFGLSLVTIVFTDETDVYWARQQVAERLQQVQAQIPAGIGTPTLGPITTGLGEIYQYVVKPKKGYEAKYDATQLRTIQDWIVRRQLLGVKGVAEVSSFGGKLKQYEIAINPYKLHAYGVTIADVFAAIEKNNQNTGGAYIEKGATVLYIRSEGLIGNIADIENISIATKNSETTLFIRDVAEVKIGYATRYGAMCYNDAGEVSGAVVMMLKGANSSEVIKNVKKRIAQIQKTMPEGVEIEPFLDRTKMVNNAIGTVEKNLLEGALIVVFVLVLFLGNFRAGLLVASVIPLAMLFAICMMNAFGVSGNLMSLGALDFGLIVDGAVIIVEAVMHQLTNHKNYSIQKYTPKAMDTAVEHAASKMMNSAVFGQIIILIVYLPIFTLQGIEGKMFKPMAQTVAFALLGAFILSLTYIPMMSAFFLSKKTQHKKNISDTLMQYLASKYQAALMKVLHFPKIVLGIVLLLFTAAILVANTLGGEFIPALEEGDFAVDTRVLSGSNLSTTIKSTQQAAHVLKTQFPEVVNVVTKIGSGEVPTDPMPMEAADMMVILKDKSEWTSAKTFPELSEKMSTALQDVPGITAGFQFPVQMRFNELMTGARQDVVCKIFGENLDTLAANAERLANIIKSINGAENIFVEPITGMPQIIIEYNRAMIAQYHLSIADINTIVHTAFAGQSAGVVFEEEKRFDLVVKIPDTDKSNLQAVQNLLVPTPDGNQLPLSQLATVQIKDGPNQIQREDAKRRIVVGFNVKGRDVQSIVEELQTKVEAQLSFPTGYFVTYGGAFENLLQAKKRLLIAVPVSLLLIFVLLYFAFTSVKQGVLIFTAIPLSAIGGILFLAARGLPFSISAGIGFIALFGVAVLNGIVLITEFNYLKKQGMQNILKIVLTGTMQRLRPVLMTAFVASLGFLPMALSNGAGAEVQRPLATVVIGGLLMATFLTLFVLPILYIMFNATTNRLTNKKPLVLLFLCVLCNAMPSQAQTPIKLQAAIDTALKNNLQLKNQQLLATYHQQLINTAKELPPTNFTSEIGQFNSIYVDTKFGIAQQFNLPVVYKKQQVLLQQNFKQQVMQVGLQQTILKKQVAELFTMLLYLNQKKQLLQYVDTLYNGFYNRATIRLQKGEDNVLEKASAESKLADIKLQLQALEQDVQIAQLQFSLLLNASNTFIPAPQEYIIDSAEKSSIDVSLHPALLFIQQEKQIAAATIEVEKKKLLPSISLGYNNTSIRGTGADDKLYTAANRFNAMQLSVGIPIFIKAQKAKITSANQQATIAENNYAAAKQQLQSDYLTALAQYKKQQQQVAYYEQQGLKNAVLITTTANEQLKAGNINYLDWLQVIQQAIVIKSNYIEAIKDLQFATISVNYFNNK